MEEKKYMSVEEAAELWNIPEEKVWKWCVKSKHAIQTHELIHSRHVWGIPAQLEITIVQGEIEEAEREEKEKEERKRRIVEEREKEERKRRVVEEERKRRIVEEKEEERKRRIVEEKEKAKTQLVEKAFYICCVIVIISFLISLFSCGVVNSNDNYISDGYGNYSFSGSTFSGLQLFLFFVYLAMPLILYGIRESLYISPVKKIIIIIALTIITLVFVFPNMLEPGSSYSRGNFLGYRW